MLFTHQLTLLCVCVSHKCPLLIMHNAFSLLLNLDVRFCGVSRNLCNKKFLTYSSDFHFENLIIETETQLSISNGIKKDY